MARIVNLIIVIFEILAFLKERKSVNYKKLVYYTRLSNLFAFISSLLFVIFGPGQIIEILRFTTTSMLVMTFIVTVCVLVPVTHDAKGLLFSNTGKYHHLLVPILSFLSYIFFEERISFKWFWIPAVITLIYGLVMLYFNETGRMEGPYPFFMIHRFGVKKTVLWMMILTLAISAISGGLAYTRPAKTDVKYVFVHGLSGWGSYDIVDEFLPYWGTWHGNLIRYLKGQGYDSYSASVAPKGSAWDRACELYAQLTGTRVDYGLAHSKAAGHERYGTDYSGRALLDEFDSSKIALIGHSFGGATVRLFSEILSNGSKEEIEATAENDLSTFFKGGHGDNLLAIVTLAAPTNGTTAYDLYEDPSFDTSSAGVPQDYEEKAKLMSGASKEESEATASWDTAAYDMHIDNALAMNERISTLNNVYYFAYPCISTKTNEDGSLVPDESITEGMFLKTSTLMAKYTGTTAKGRVIDSSWQPNDGLVNVISAGAPFGEKASEYTKDTVPIKGQWYVMPLTFSDHMSLQGGLTRIVDVKPFYIELVKLLATLAS